MTDFRNLEQPNDDPEAANDDTVHISDLPPETRSHYLLLRLVNARERLRENMQAFSRRAGNALQQFVPTQHTTSTIEQPARDETGLEIDDLPPSARDHYLLLTLQALTKRLRSRLSRRKQNRPVLTRTQRRARIGRTLTALGLCATLLLLLVGNTPSLRARLVGLFEPATPTSTSVAYSSLSQGSVSIIIEQPGNPNATVIPTGNLGSLPATCPRASTLQAFLSPVDQPGLGSGPLWLVGFDGPTAALIHLHPTSQLPGTAFGWYQTLTVFIRKGSTGTFVLHSEGQDGKNEAEFSYANASSIGSSYGDTMNFAPSLVLSLNDSSGLHFTPDGDWEMIPLEILVPQAGCYALQTTWSNSTWTEYFAAGGSA